MTVMLTSFPIVEGAKKVFPKLYSGSLKLKSSEEFLDLLNQTDIWKITSLDNLEADEVGDIITNVITEYFKLFETEEEFFSNFFAWTPDANFIQTINKTIDDIFNKYEVKNKKESLKAIHFKDFFKKEGRQGLFAKLPMEDSSGKEIEDSVALQYAILYKFYSEILNFLSTR